MIDKVKNMNLHAYSESGDKTAISLQFKDDKKTVWVHLFSSAKINSIN